MTSATSYREEAAIDRPDFRKFIEDLFPICRSITGDGVRESLRIIGRIVGDLKIVEVKSGTRVFDWTIPKEWNIRDAYIQDSSGTKIIDFKNCNLHVLNYSSPVDKTVTLDELKKHVFTDPKHSKWIPYRTSYYKEEWGFCMRHDQLLSLVEDEYHVYIDSELSDGSLTYGEFFKKGDSDEEVFFSCHVCHPSLANDNLSGISVASYLAKFISGLSTRYSYRFVFVPGTIGAITWLSENERTASKIKYGLVLTLLGHPSGYTYKRSRRGNSESDKALIHVLKNSSESYKVIDFFPYGYDERQYCSPGFNLPIGCLMRTPFAEYPEYHTSADNLELVKDEQLLNSYYLIKDFVEVIEHNKKYISLNPKCEPQLGSRGLYEFIGGTNDSQRRQLAMLWVLNLSDGTHSLLDISERAEVSFSLIKEMAAILVSKNLIKECG
jgi:aminopeptidase-like protein